MDCIAHRGFAETNPENTLVAVRAAAGADLIEVDVRRCGSGELVVVHDAELGRISDGHGLVADHTLAELQNLDVLGTGRGVPTLDAVFAAAPTRLNVELKEEGLAADCLAVADGRGVSPLFSAFDPDVLAAVRDAADGAGTDGLGVETALIFAEEPAASLGRARDLGCVAIHPHASLCDPAFVERAHDAGLAVNAWTVRDVSTARRLHAAGVDGLIADRNECVE